VTLPGRPLFFKVCVMALVQFVEPISQMRGKHGDIVFTMSDDQGISRPLVLPENPRTEAQVTVRQLLKALAVAWKSLNASQVQAWAAVAALVNPRRNSFGNYYPFTAQSLFVAVNFHHYCVYGAIETTPPADLVCPPTPEIVAVTFNQSLGFLTFEIVQQPVYHGWWRVRVTPPTLTTAAKARPNALRFPGPELNDGYIGAEVAFDTEAFDLPLNDTLSTLFAYSTTLQFGIEFQPLSDDFVPNAEPDFRPRVQFTKV